MVSYKGTIFIRHIILNLTLVEINTVDDTQIDYYDSMSCTNEFLRDNTNCVIDKERLISVSSGVINKGKDWYKIENVDTIQIDSGSEINRRITVARNQSNESLRYRNSYCEAIAELERIITEKKSFPQNILDISDDNLKIGFTDDSKDEGYRYNIVNSNDENEYVTICYIGSASKDQALQIYTSLRKMFWKSETRDKERVVVYYKQGTNIEIICDPNFAKITETHDYSDDSIAK